MSNLVNMNASEASSNQGKKMDTNDSHRTKTTVYGRCFDERPTYPSGFGHQQTFQPRAATSTPVNNENQSAIGETKRKVVHFFLTKNSEIELKTSENAWIPGRMRAESTNDRQSSGDGDTKMEEIRKKLMSILNKITPENMDQLSDTINALPIETEEHLTMVIQVLFQKAIDEPNFTPQYAYVCKTLKDREVKIKERKEKVTFKNVIIKYCRDRFELMQVHEKNLLKKLKDLNDCNDQDMKRQLQVEYNDDERLHRKKSIGNCRFMCELYKVQILTSRALETCIKHLLKSPNEETLECVCNILNHAGKTLNHKVIFEQLSDYTSSAYKTKIPTRIRFMILDTIDLKDNSWVPRNCRKKPEFCKPKVQSNARKPDDKQFTRVQNAPAVFSTAATQQPKAPIKWKLPTEIKKNDEHIVNTLAKCTKTLDLNSNGSSPMNSNAVIEGEKSSVVHCVSPVNTKNSHSGQSLNDENNETQDIHEKCRSIIDQINEENMDSSAKTILSLQIKTEDSLKHIANLLFEKAVDEPEFTPYLAHVCLVMKNVEVRSTNQKENVTFRKLLIKMCQDLFESMIVRKRFVAKARNDIETCKDKEIKKQLQSEFDRNEIVYYRRSTANCRFICELLKVKILAPPIAEICVTELVMCPKELSFECACVILQLVGDRIYHDGILEKLLEYSTVHKNKFSSRIHSMILDTVELKNTDWVKRNIDDKPPPILERTNEETFKESSVKCINTLPSTMLQPMLTTQDNTHPELNIHKTVKSIINSVNADNINTKINELSVHIKNMDVMEKTIDLLFARAKNNPKTIPELVVMCSSMRNLTTSPVVEAHIKPTSMKKLIEIRCNKALLAGIHNHPIESKPTSKESYAFIGELFNENVFTVHILLEFLKVLPEKLSNDALENICTLLKTAGKKIEQAYSLKKTVRKLTDMVSNDVEGIFSGRNGALLKALVELRDKKWVSN